MLHNKSLKIFFSLHLTISMADFLSSQVVVHLRFFLYKIFFFFSVTKIGVERLLNFVTLSFIYLYWHYISHFQSSRLVLRMGEG